MQEELKGLRFAVMGVTGMVGQEMLGILLENGVKPQNVNVFASKASAGRILPYGQNGRLLVKSTEEADFSGIDVALLAVEADISETLAPKLAKQGVLVVDNSSRWRMDKKVPLVVPEVNAAAISGFSKWGIIANPNCATIQMLVALKPLHDAFYARQVVACTYQSVSGAGLAGTRALTHELEGGMNLEGPFVALIAGNVIPHIGGLPDSYGPTGEEQKMMAESRRILHSGLKVSATCVRVPVVTGHGVAVHVLFDQPLDMDRVVDILTKAPGVRLAERLEEATPLMLDGSDDVVVDRIRRDPGMHKTKGLAFWCVANNVRKGAALNAVQIVAEWRKQGYGPK